jgi:16S rRNA (guanine527-N7)-methyltransferase
MTGKLTLDSCQKCLGDRIQLNPEVRNRLAQFLGMICEWNEYASLVSRNECSPALWGHVADSLAILPALPEGTIRMLDVGTGAGFPAIVAKLVRPEIELVCAERSEKKVAFLRKLEAILGISGLDLRLGNFPDIVLGQNFDVITARAVEQPKKLATDILDYVQKGAIHVCQIEDIASAARERPDLFHVEQMADDWDSENLRRGNLYTIHPAT